jgi:cytoskeleton protein RodZ
LREAREAQALSVVEVASRLRLDARVVNAIETSSWKLLPAPAYVRGYIRAYAALLGVDAQPLIERYDAEAGEAPPLKAATSRPAVQARSTDRPVKLMTYAIIITLITLLGAWSYSEYRHALFLERLTLEQLRSMEGSRTAVPSLGYDYPIVIHPEQLPPVADAGDPEDGAAPLEASLPADDAAPAPADAQLELHLSDDAWIEIVDAEERRLVYRLGRAGEVVRASGVPPYRLTIGNAPAVSLLYEGEPLAVGEYDRHGIARITIDDQGVRQP